MTEPNEADPCRCRRLDYGTGICQECGQKATEREMIENLRFDLRGACSHVESLQKHLATAKRQRNAMGGVLRDCVAGFELVLEAEQFLYGADAAYDRARSLIEAVPHWPHSQAADELKVIESARAVGPTKGPPVRRTIGHTIRDGVKHPIIITDD